MITTTFPDRLPPQNIEAEQCVLGCILIDPPTVLDIEPILGADDFYRDSHRDVYTAILAIHATGRPIDPIALVEELDRRGTLAGVGGETTIVELMKAPPSSASAEYYAQVVSQKATARDLIESCHRMIRDAQSNLYSADELIERSEKGVFALSMLRRRTGLERAADSLRESLNDLGRRDEGIKPGLATGFHDFDTLTGGFQPGELIVVAARPSIGKSAWALTAAEHIASHGTGVLFCSLEMSLRELGDRMICGVSGVDNDRYMHSWRLTESDREAIDRSADRLRDIPLHFDTSATQTVARIASEARRLRMKRGSDRIGLVVVDYLQLVTPDQDNPRAPRHEQVGAMSRQFKQLAKELDVPLVLICALNREAEKREDKRPSIADLRESGCIEQDANMVLLLHRPEFYDECDRPGEADLIIAKNRSGPTGKIRMVFTKKTTRFSSFARPQ